MRDDIKVSGEIPYLYNVKVEGGAHVLNSVVLATITKVGFSNSAVKIEGVGGQKLYLYIVKIGNVPEILMSSLTSFQNQPNT